VRMIVTLMVAAMALAGSSRPLAGASGTSCSAVRFTAKLDAGQSFARRVGGLEFKLRAAHGNGLCGGWTFTLEDAGGHDFIYPVNFPLRFNPSQLLGCSYGLTVRQGLEMNRRLRFILTGRDYLRLRPLMEDALWPVDSPDPKHAGEKYLNAIRSIQTGLLRLDTLRSDVSPDGLIRSATFQVELVAPAGFHFAPILEPHPAPCPTNPAQ
jgi:hypothetical protein